MSDNDEPIDKTGRTEQERIDELAKLETENASFRERVANADKDLRAKNEQIKRLGEALVGMELALRGVVAVALGMENAEQMLPPALNFMANLCTRQAGQISQMRTLLARVELERAAMRDQAKPEA